MVGALGVRGGGCPCSLWGLAGGGEPQAASIPTMPKVITLKHSHAWACLNSWRNCMGLILLEALGALLLLVLIVWWTMFSGRKNGELPKRESDSDHKKLK
jgi:hypothetical protein